jgi:hypothetical protein
VPWRRHKRGFRAHSRRRKRDGNGNGILSCSHIVTYWIATLIEATTGEWSEVVSFSWGAL